MAKPDDDVLVFDTEFGSVTPGEALIAASFALTNRSKRTVSNVFHVAIQVDPANFKGELPGEPKEFWARPAQAQVLEYYKKTAVPVYAASYAVMDYLRGLADLGLKIRVSSDNAADDYAHVNALIHKVFPKAQPFSYIVNNGKFVKLNDINTKTDHLNTLLFAHLPPDERAKADFTKREDFKALKQEALQKIFAQADPNEPVAEHSALYDLGGMIAKWWYLN